MKKILSALLFISSAAFSQSHQITDEINASVIFKSQHQIVKIQTEDNYNLLLTKEGKIIVVNACDGFIDSISLVDTTRMNPHTVFMDFFSPDFYYGNDYKTIYISTMEDSDTNSFIWYSKIWKYSIGDKNNIDSIKLVASGIPSNRETGSLISPYYDYEKGKAYILASTADLSPSDSMLAQSDSSIFGKILAFPYDEKEVDSDFIKYIFSKGHHQIQSIREKRWGSECFSIERRKSAYQIYSLAKGTNYGWPFTDEHSLIDNKDKYFGKDFLTYDLVQPVYMKNQQKECGYCYRIDSWAYHLIVIRDSTSNLDIYDYDSVYTFNMDFFGQPQSISYNEWDGSIYMVSKDSSQKQSYLLVEILGKKDNCPSGIASQDKDAIKIYPNPLSSFDLLYLEKMPLGEKQILISDQLGREVFRLASKDEETTISLPLLPIGIYYLSVSGNAGVLNRKIAVQ